jgi:regulatory protein
MNGETAEKAFNRAVKLLAYQARSVAELRGKLIQLGFSTKIADRTLKRLCSLNLLNDESFARSWALERAEGRGYGPLRIETELQKKGIEPSLIRQVLQENFSGPTVQERAKKLVQRRFRGKDLKDDKTLRRAASFLQRRGYTDAVIGELLKEPEPDDP